jgi:hypothetical protein
VTDSVSTAASTTVSAVTATPPTPAMSLGYAGSE